ncbi:MAG: DNA mismatch repair endonuclease MutL [Anaerovoracaceae bacterium]
MIKILEKNVAAQIAAGEVVERPLSIVKELVENSIDALSDNITVEIKNGGKTYIRISDNGTGIDASEVETAFLRHATSKIKNIEDLDSLVSLGFRGEALASIASVTKTTIITKTQYADVGIKLVLEGGEIISRSPMGAPTGTTIIIENLFFNTPARLKFMKTDRSEGSAVVDFISNVAMAYPDIKIRMINNENTLFSTSGKGDRLKAIITITSKDSLSKLIPFHHTEEGITIEGFISNPTESKANRKSQIFFVNGRSINSNVIEEGISQGYAARLFEGRYPIAYLFITVPPNIMDVNIHPNKKEVRFYDERVISNIIKNAIIEALNTKDGIGKIQPKPSTKSDYFKFTKDEVGEIRISNIEEQTKISIKADTNSIEDKPKIDENKINKNINLNQKIKEESNEVDVKNILSTYNHEKLVEEQKQEILEKKIDQIKSDTYKPKAFDMASIVPLEQIFGTYIQAVDENTLYIVDQHAAHERIFFEKFRNDYLRREIPKQGLLIPITITIPVALSKNDHVWLSTADSLGYTIEEFGPNTYRITQIPSYFNLSEAEEFINDFISMTSEINDYESPKLLDKIATRACKAAIKANDSLSKDEVKRLFEDLNKCENPFSCPHGRPTFIKLTKDDIEKKFKRK